LKKKEQRTKEEPDLCCLFYQMFSGVSLLEQRDMKLVTWKKVEEKLNFL